MHKLYPRLTPASLRKPIAMLVAYLTLVTPLAPVVAQGVKVKRGQSPAPVSPVTQAPSKTGSASGSVKRLTLPAPHILVNTPNIVATKTDNLPQSTQVVPGGQITYTVTITNTGTGDATGVSFSDTVDPNTSVDANSAVMAAGDDYNTDGNVKLVVPAPGLLANDLDIDAGSNAGMTTSVETKSSASCVGCNNVSIAGDGSFTYDPPVGFSGTDSFTYTAHTAGGKTATVTARVVVAGRIWFVNNNAGACPASPCDGRLSHPFTDLASFQAVNGDGAAGHPQNGDTVFIYESATDYTGPVTLRTGQLLIGQDTTAADLPTAAGLAAPSGTSQLPVPAPSNATVVNITTTTPTTDAITLGSGNTLRGFTVGATTGAKIAGSAFGTLIVGNSASPDVTLSGAGQALSLTNGTLSVAGAFKSVATTGSAGPGVLLSQVADSDGAGGGSFAFNGVSVSGTVAAEGIKVAGSTADLNFGATSVTGGTDGVSLSNNTAGTRTFSTLTVSGVSGIGFRHFDPDGGGAQVGGGTTTVTGATTITNPTGKGINIDSANANVSFAATTVNKNASSGIGVDLTNNATRTISFSSLDSTTTNAFALNANASGTVNTSGGNLTQSGVGGGAASLTNTTLGLTFASVSSNGGATGLVFSGGSGTFTATTTNLQNNTANGISMSSTSVAANFGNTTVNSSAATAVSLTSASGNVTFADFDLSPDSGQRGLDVTTSSGTVTSTSGTITTTNAAAINTSTAALSMVLDDVSANISAATAASGVSLTTTTGSLTVNATSGSSITGGNAAAFNVSGGTVSVTYKGGISQATTNQPLVSIAGGHATGTITFNTGTLSATGGTGLQFDNADGTYNFNGTTTLNGGNAGVDILNGSAGTFTFGTGTSIGAATSPSGIAFNIDGTAAAVTANVTYSGTIKQLNAASAVFIKSKTGGTTTFAGAITASTSTANAIDMPSGNTGSTTNFTGGLSLTTTSGIGLNAAGGGTITATQDNSTIVNTVTSTTGAAINVSSTTIGTNGMTFRSVNVTGTGANPASGIILNTVRNGAGTGNFTITGNSSGICGGSVTNTTTPGTAATVTAPSTADCTGGTIQSTSGVGVSLTSVGNISLTRVRVLNSGTKGIQVDTATGFTLDHSNVTDSAGGATDEGVNLINVSGTISITNDIVDSAPHNQIFVDNNNTNLTSFTLSGSTIKCTSGNACQPAGSTGNDGLLFNIRGTTVVQSALVTDSFFTGLRATGIQALTADSSRIGSSSGGVINSPAASNSITVQNSTFTSNNIAVDFSLSQVSNEAFQLLSNTMQFHRSHAVNIASATGADTGPTAHFFVGKVDNNVIGVQGSKDSGSVIGNGMRLVVQGTSTQGSMTVSNNTIREVVNADIISIVGQDGTGTPNAVAFARFNVINNTLPTPSGSNQSLCGPANTTCVGNGIFVLADQGYPVCVNITGNNIFDVKSFYPNGTYDIYLAERAGPPTGAQLTVAGSGSATTWITGHNTLAGTNQVIDEGGNVSTGTCGAFPSEADFGEAPPPPPASAATQQQQSAAASNDITAQPFVSMPVAAQPVAAQSKPAKGEAQAAASASLSEQAADAQSQPPVSKSADGSSKSVAAPSKSSTPVVVMSATNVSATIGTLKAGDTVQISFTVTVGSPVPNGTLKVSNQGTVTYNNPSGPGTLSVLTDDPDVGSNGAGEQDKTDTQLLTPPDISALDAKVGEPSTGTTSLVFVVRLNHAYSAGGTSVSYTTADGTATGGAAGSCSTPGVDYETTAGTLTFGPTQTVNTVSVPVCASGISSDKTLTLNLTTNGGTVGQIVRAQATGTITQANAAGTFLISEIRTSGPAGLGDDFVELYNNTDSDLTVPAGGYGVFKMGATCADDPVLVGTVPAGTIKARSHFLLTGSQYSLANYGGTGAAAGDGQLNATASSADIESDRNVGVFSTTDPTQLSTATRLDAVGFGTNTGAVCDLLLEGTTLPALSGSTLEHSYFRNLATGTPADTNNNSADFLFADTAATLVAGVQRLGAPGPENKNSPVNHGATIKATLFDPAVSSSNSPNRVRDSTQVVPGQDTGTLLLRRTFTNNTGGSVTKLRFRVVNMTAGPGGGAGIADLRLLSTASGNASTSGGTKTWVAMPLDSPPTQALGGGMNSTVTATLPGGSLSAGSSVNVQFTLRVVTTGSFNFFVIVEGLP